MTKYRVYMTVRVSQVVEIEADSAYEAADLASGRVDHPNISNKFEEDGEWHPTSIDNLDADTEVWVGKNDEDYPDEEHEDEW